MNLWNVEAAGIDIGKKPWSALPQGDKKMKEKAAYEEIEAAWDIMKIHADGSGATASLINGPHVHEMPDMGVPYTYIYSSSTSCKRKRESYITLSPHGGGTFYPIIKNGVGLVDQHDGCALRQCDAFACAATARIGRRERAHAFS